MKMKNDQVYMTNKEENLERPVFLVTILGGSGVQAQMRCYAWGTIDGHPFFDTPEDIRIELFNNPPFMIQSPTKGMTFDENGRYRELRKEESVILQ